MTKNEEGREIFLEKFDIYDQNPDRKLAFHIFPYVYIYWIYAFPEIIYQWKIITVFYNNFSDYLRGGIPPFPTHAAARYFSEKLLVINGNLEDGPVSLANHILALLQLRTQ